MVFKEQLCGLHSPKSSPFFLLPSRSSAPSRLGHRQTVAETEKGQGPTEEGEVVKTGLDTPFPGSGGHLSILFLFYSFYSILVGSVSSTALSRGLGEDVWSKGTKMGSGESRRGNKGPEIKK